MHLHAWYRRQHLQLEPDLRRDPARKEPTGYPLLGPGELPVPGLQVDAAARDVTTHCPGLTVTAVMSRSRGDRVSVSESTKGINARAQRVLFPSSVGALFRRC
eukprot:1297165-Rhodomonas_salina.2